MASSVMEVVVLCRKCGYGAFYDQTTNHQVY